MRSIEELVGQAKNGSDLTCKNVRVRYTQSQSVNSGQYMRHTLPKMPEAFLDCRSLRLRFQLTINSTDPNICIDGPTALSLFSRIRVISGSSVIMDVIDSNIFACIDENINGSASGESKYDRFIRGHGDLTERRLWANTTREYIIPFPRNSVLNCSALIPLWKCSDFHIELYNADGKNVLHSPLGDQTCGYVMTDLEMHANYLSSRSISNYFNVHPLQFHIQDTSHRYGNCVGQTSLIKFSSAHSSLTRIITLLRNSNDIGVTVAERCSRSISAAQLDNFQLYVNSTRWYDINVDSLPQMFRHFVDSFKNVLRSEWFDIGYETSKFLLVNNLNAAPADFNDSLVSGVKTSAHNSDISLELNFRLPPVSVICDSFLLADGLITLKPGGDLTLSY